MYWANGLISGNPVGIPNQATPIPGSGQPERSESCERQLAPAGRPSPCPNAMKSELALMAATVVPRRSTTSCSSAINSVLPVAPDILAARSGSETSYEPSQCEARSAMSALPQPLSTGDRLPSGRVTAPKCRYRGSQGSGAGRRDLVADAMTPEALRDSRAGCPPTAGREPLPAPTRRRVPHFHRSQ